MQRRQKQGDGEKKERLEVCTGTVAGTSFGNAAGSAILLLVERVVRRWAGGRNWGSQPPDARGRKRDPAAGHCSQGRTCWKRGQVWPLWCVRLMLMSQETMVSLRKEMDEMDEAASRREGTTVVA